MTTEWDTPDLPSAKATEINKARQGTYGDPTPNMEMLAGLWSAFLGMEISAEDASEMLVLLKVMREKQSGYNPDYPDNVDDQVGWSNVLYMVKEAHRGSDPAAG